jgi:transcriptional regulator with XRE-family HTH domain
MDTETMGARISRLMEAKGLTQSSVARLLGLRRATVHQWVHDTSQPTPANLVMLAELLGTDVHYLVFGPSRQPDGGFPSPLGPDRSANVVSIRRRRRT